MDKNVIARLLVYKKVPFMGVTDIVKYIKIISKTYQVFSLLHKLQKAMVLGDIVKISTLLLI